MTRLAIATIGLVLASATSLAFADDGDERIEAAVALFEAEDYEGAAIMFKSVYDDTKRGDALFGWAQALRLGDKCAEALPLYARYLEETSPEPHQVEATEAAMALCPAAEPEPPPKRESEPEANATKPIANPIEQPETGGEVIAGPTDRGAGRDWLTLGLGAAAVSGLAVGTTFYILAKQAESDAEDAETYPEYDNIAERAESRQTIAFVGFGAAVAAGAGIVIWQLTKPKAKDVSSSLSVAPTIGGAAASVRVSF